MRKPYWHRYPIQVKISEEHFQWMKNKAKEERLTTKAFAHVLLTRIIEREIDSE